MQDTESLEALGLKTTSTALTLVPGLGGSVGAFTFRGADILRPLSSSAAASPLTSAGFPLFPFSGRVANGKFTWNHRDVSLAPNFPPEPHSIHGQAWLAPWTVQDHTQSSARLTYDHSAGDWPWAYHCEQVFTLRESGLDLGMSLKNTSDVPMPAGFGWHPYFPRGDARIRVPVEKVWTAGSGMIPDRLALPGADADVSDWQHIDNLALDNAFTVAGQTSRIEWPQRRIGVQMTADPMFGHVVIFTPAGEDFFCIEPVSHAPDAVNSRHETSVTGLKSLLPGDTLSARIRLDVYDLDAKSG